ncbi:MAG TPA: chemotaxis protein CheW [Geobacteraceae bacterium]|nr:chemotaxis protein CheW [Geobacteraceae bacterium]
MMDGSNRLLVFTLRGSRYALTLRNVAEVMEPPLIYPIPHAPHFFLGIMNFHGNLVSVLDLARFLSGAPRNPHGKILVLDTRIANLSLWVDTIENICSTDAILEEYKSDENLVEKLLMMADGEVKMLSVENLLDKLEEILAAAGV